MDATTEAGGEGMGAGQQLASAAAAQAGQVSQQAADQAKHMAGTAVEQTRQVGQEAATQARTVIGETKDKAHQQAEMQTQQVAQALERLGFQARALLAGRPEEAESLPQYADSAVSRLEELTRRVQDGGFDGVMADVQGFARRRPGLFLLGAAAVGFGMGRMLRAGAAHPTQDHMPAEHPTAPLAAETPTSEMAAPLGDIAVSPGAPSQAPGAQEW